MSAVISLGIIFGAFFSFDLFFSAKRQGTFIRQLVLLLTVSIPPVYKEIFQSTGTGSESFAIYWVDYFYITFLITLFIFFITSYFFIFHSLIKRIEKNKSEKLFTYFDFLFKGYSGFKNDLEQTFKDDSTYRENKEDTILNVNNELRLDLIKFITQIYETIDESDIDGYFGYVLIGFVQKFMGEHNARFTLRQLNTEKEVMSTRFTTNADSIPGDISLKKKNLIVKSMELRKPLIYTENIASHYKTTRNSIKKGIYDDYVSFCLLKTNEGKPYYSICLDVKGESAKKRMKVLVDSLMFDVICNAITLKILNSIKNVENNQK